MQHQQSQALNSTMVYNDSFCVGDNTFHGHSIKIVLPPKPRYEGDNYNSSNVSNDEGQSKMDVCALTLSCLAQDPNLPSSKLPFAWKLYEMLETVHKNDVDTDIVSWVDGGNAFKVHDLERFVDEIVPTYFKQSKYKSFQRQLYFYGFTREASSGKKSHTPGSYRHPKFVRGMKALCLAMAPKKTKKRVSKKANLGSSAVTATDGAVTAQSVVARTVSVEVAEDNSLQSTNDNGDDIAPIPLHRTSSITATTQRAKGIIHDRGSNDDMTPIPLPLASYPNTTTTADTIYHRKNSCGSNPQLQFRQQQNSLHRLQIEGFLRSLRRNEPAPPSAPPLQAFESDGRACSIFGGTFHVVGKKKSSF